MEHKFADFNENSVIEPDAPEDQTGAVRRTLIIACGALARETLAVMEMNNMEAFDITCLPAKLHGSPMRIPEAVREKIRKHRHQYDRVLCLYGDCGTSGALDAMLAEEGVERIAGAHCYAFFAGLDAYKVMDEQEFGTFFLTDFLVRHFDAFFLKSLKVDKYPEMLTMLFGNFRRMVFLQQTFDTELEVKAKRIAARLGLPLVLCQTGLSDLAGFIAGPNAVSPDLHGGIQHR